VYKVGTANTKRKGRKMKNYQKRREVKEDRKDDKSIKEIKENKKDNKGIKDDKKGGKEHRKDHKVKEHNRDFKVKEDNKDDKVKEHNKDDKVKEHNKDFKVKEHNKDDKVIEHNKENKRKKDNCDMMRTGQREIKKRKVCSVSSKCGGCQWIDKNYEEQLQIKNTVLRKLMKNYCRPEPIIAMEEPFYYRNKIHAAFGENRRHEVISGIYEQKSHRIVPVDSCLIENRKADEIVISIRGLLKSFKIRPYNEDSGYGLLRHVLIRVGHVTGQIMVVLVLSSPIMPSKNNFVKALRKLHPEITTIVVNVNDQDTSMVLGEREQVIYGKGYIEDELCGKTFRISPKSFYQVNPVQTEKLYNKAMEYAGLKGSEVVVDAYCGTGTIGMIASDYAARVIGVELNRDAVCDAINNAKRNQIQNIQFYQNDAGRFLLNLAQQGEEVDVLFMDPPRSGSSEEFLNAVAKIKPKRIVYISCNPETLVRDLDYLIPKGFSVENCVGVDMFPFTGHVECVVLIQRK